MTLSKKKKTLLLSIIVVGIAATMLGAGTLAYFSASQTSGTNLFTAGTIAMSVNGQDPWTGTFNATLQDLKPCMKGWGNVTLQNTGTNPMDVWLIISSVTTAGGLHPSSELVEDPSDTINHIDNVTIYDLVVNGTEIISDTAGYTISANATVPTIGVKDNYVWLGNLTAGSQMTVNQSFKLNCTTTNWAQGDNMTFVVTFYGQQREPIESPPPAPGTQLSGHARPY
jgi:spore coat-associated protein N